MRNGVELPASPQEWEALRHRAGLTKAELARRCELDVRTIFALEAGEPVHRRTRLLVAAALGVRVFPPVEAGVGAAA